MTKKLNPPFIAFHQYFYTLYSLAQNILFFSLYIPYTGNLNKVIDNVSDDNHYG